MDRRVAAGYIDAMGAPRWQGGALRPQRLTATAAPLLIVRVLEGLIAWVFFNEYFSVAPVRGFWLVQVAFIGNLLLNLLFALRYRRGAASVWLMAADVAANLLSLGVPIAASGGHASPLLLLLPLQSVAYALVFGAPAMAGFLLGGVAMLGGIELADRAVLISVVPLGALVHGSFAHVVVFAVVEALIGGPLATLALLRAIGDEEGARGEWRSAERAGRGGPSAAVANALFMVNDAISRVTRLDDILHTVVEAARDSMEMDYCGIALWTKESGHYMRAVVSGKHEDGRQVATGLHLSPEQVPDFEWVRRLDRCAVVPVTESLQVAPVDVPAVIIAPLSSGKQFFGVMEFARRHPRPFTDRDMRLADGIARQAAVAIERARLVEESSRLVRALESTEEAVLITNARRRIIFANNAFVRTLGYRKEEVIGRDALEITGPPPEPLEQFQETLLRRSWRGETVIQRKDGSTIPILLNASLIRDVDGKAVLGAVAILEDISEAKRFQEQMQRADRLAAVGEMAAGIAHEVNNALAVIFGQTEEDGSRTPEQLHAALAKVDEQARRIAEIVQGVLGFARPRPPRPQPVDLAELTAKTLDLVGRDIARQGVRLETVVGRDLPPARADPQQLQQVLFNLLTNALQAMAGAGTGGWLRVEVQEEGSQLALRVIDSGSGIPPDVLPRIFDPFFSTKEQGSGLGLSVSYAIAQANGGDLRVDSEVGRGTTFTLLLPIAEADSATVLERVLLVDDDDEVAEAIATMLRREGLQVTRAATGAEGLALLEQDSWDAVFLDVRLPDVSGPEIYRRLESSRPELAQRVVFVTGGVWRSGSRLRQELPSQPVLAKPCTQEQVRAVLRQLRAHGRQAA